MGSKSAKNGALLGAAFIMATSAIGPGFLTQTAAFTNSFHGSFGFIILASVLLSFIVQLNVWRILCVSDIRGQDLANRVLPGLGYLVAFLVVLGGLVFNIANVGGGALGFNALVGLPLWLGYLFTGGIAIAVFLVKDALAAVDRVAKLLGGVMILVIFVMIVVVQPPLGTALKESVLPSESLRNLFPAILTLLGGTVGGYITFAGAHRLIDAKITGRDHAEEIMQSSIMGIGIAALVRVLLFLAIFGVVVKGVTLGAGNPAADAFREGAGNIGYRFFGLVLLCAAVTSVIGAAYTSVSFLKTFHHKIATHEKWVIIGFIVVSTAFMMFAGRPANLLILAGALNGLILPLTLGVCLVAARRRDIVGESYKHPSWLFIAGILVVLITAYIGAISLQNLEKLFM